MKIRLKENSAAWMLSKYAIASHYHEASGGLVHGKLLDEFRKALNDYDIGYMERKLLHHLKSDPDGDEFAFWLGEKAAIHYWNSIYCKKNDTRKKR